MEDKVTAILKLKPPYDADPDAAIRELAQFSLDNFGEGGRPDEACFENRCGYCNTPVSNGYVRVLIGKAYGVALEYIEANYDNPIAELVRVEWNGQDRVPVEQPVLDEDGNSTGEMETVYVEQLFQTGTQDVLDEQGNVIATTPVYLVRF
ncbi:MAG: hypothetical protein LHW56_01475 [Candidatus Cloacimonetes bacterium]|nr:hypothetical protein [Candidatus Cloacimonadota bacterium]MDY0171557.1 hypothetical protein [Candidatus Cloacimonadaceae bacterium]